MTTVLTACAKQLGANEASGRARSRRGGSASRSIASALALVVITACAATSRESNVPGACAELALRSSGRLPWYASAIAAVPEGIWVLRIEGSKTRKLTLFGDDRRPRVDLDVHALFASAGEPRKVRIASDGRVLGVFAELDSATSALATVQATGAFTLAAGIDIPGTVVGDPRGRFVVHDANSLRFVEGHRIVRGNDVPLPDPRDEHHYPERVIAPTALGYVQVLAIVEEFGAVHVSARRLDVEGDPVGDAVVLEASEPSTGVVEPDPHVASSGDGAVAVWYGADGLMLARIGADGRLAAGPTPIEPGMHVEALVVDDTAIWLAGFRSSRWASSTHDWRHIERLVVMRLDHAGNVTAQARLRTPTGSTLDPRVVAVGPGQLFGLHLREVAGRLDSRRDHITSRWLDVRCR